MTTDARSIALEDADVMQHGRLFHKRAVKAKLWMAVANLQRPARNRYAMCQENATSLAILWIILVYQTHHPIGLYSIIHDLKNDRPLLHFGEKGEYLFIDKCISLANQKDYS